MLRLRVRKPPPVLSASSFPARIPDGAAQERGELRLLEPRLCHGIHPSRVGRTAIIERSALREDLFLLGAVDSIELKSELLQTQLPKWTHVGVRHDGLLLSASGGACAGGLRGVGRTKA